MEGDGCKDGVGASDKGKVSIHNRPSGDTDHWVNKRQRCVAYP
jgi:hypothetical protein